MISSDGEDEVDTLEYLGRFPAVALLYSQWGLKDFLIGTLHRIFNLSVWLNHFLSSLLIGHRHIC